MVVTTSLLLLYIVIDIDLFAYKNREQYSMKILKVSLRILNHNSKLLQQFLINGNLIWLTKYEKRIADSNSYGLRS